MTEWADQRHHDNAPAHCTALMQACFGKATHHPGLLAPPTAQIWLATTSGFSQSENRRWKRGDLWMWRSHSTQAQSTLSHCQLTSPTGEWLFRMHSKVSSDWLPSYVKVTPEVLEVFTTAGYFPDSPRTDIRRHHKKIQSPRRPGDRDLWPVFFVIVSFLCLDSDSHGARYQFVTNKTKTVIWDKYVLKKEIRPAVP